MITWLFVFAVAAATVAALARWRLGIVLAIVIGVLQDPIRKLTPDAPAIMAICSVPIWLAACANLFTQERRIWVRIRSARPGVVRALSLFVVSLLPATLVVFQYGVEAWRMALIGIFGYLAPLLALAAGFHYAKDSRHLQRLLMFYCVFTAVMLVGSPLQYLNVLTEWPALGTEAMGMRWVRFMGSTQVELIAGFYRSPDIMGWHAAALVMLALTLALHHGRARMAPWLLLAAWGMLGVFVGARRKMIMMPVVWAAFLVVAYLRAGRTRRVISLVAISAITLFALHFASGEVDIREEYYVYASTAAAEAPERLLQDTLAAVWSTYQQSGLLGRGIGSVSQGTQHVGLASARGWQESGLSKIAVELGFPGLLCAVFLAAALTRACLDETRRAAGLGTPGTLQIGLLGFVAANGAAFLVSHQVYGDALVMTLTAFLLGAALSGPRWCPSPAVAARTRNVPWQRADQRQPLPSA